MLKTSGFAKSQITRVHTGSFNPLTLNPGAAAELEDTRSERINPPAYRGTGAVYKRSEGSI